MNYSITVLFVNGNTKEYRVNDYDIETEGIIELNNLGETIYLPYNNIIEIKVNEL